MTISSEKPTNRSKSKKSRKKVVISKRILDLEKKKRNSSSSITPKTLIHYMGCLGQFRHPKSMIDLKALRTKSGRRTSRSSKKSSQHLVAGEEEPRRERC